MYYSSFWLFLAIIIVVAIVSNAAVKIIKTSRMGDTKESRQRVKDLEIDVSALEEELEDARHRIAVLEKIVTDNRFDLGKQIDDLAT